MRYFAALAALLVALTLPVCADEGEQLPEPTPYAPTMEEFLQEVSDLVPYPTPGFEVDEDGMLVYPAAAAAAEVEDVPVVYAAGTVYPGSWSSGVLDYFAGVMLQHPGVPYCAYRESQYIYCLYYGKDVTYSGGVFGGSGSYLRYNAYNSSYTISRGSGSFEINGASGFVYSNLDGSYAAFEGERSGFNASVLAWIACVGIGLWIMRRILFRG